MSAFLLHFLHLYSRSVRKIGSFWFDLSSFSTRSEAMQSSQLPGEEKLLCEWYVWLWLHCLTGGVLHSEHPCAVWRESVVAARMPQTATCVTLVKSKGSIRTVNQEPHTMMWGWNETCSRTSGIVATIKNGNVVSPQSLLEPELVPPLPALKYTKVQQSSPRPSSHWFSWDAEDTSLLTTLALNVHVLRVAFVFRPSSEDMARDSFHQHLLGKLSNSTGVRAWLDNMWYFTTWICELLKKVCLKLGSALPSTKKGCLKKSCPAILWIFDNLALPLRLGVSHMFDASLSDLEKSHTPNLIRSKNMGWVQWMSISWINLRA